MRFFERLERPEVAAGTFDDPVVFALPGFMLPRPRRSPRPAHGFIGGGHASSRIVASANCSASFAAAYRRAIGSHPAQRISGPNTHAHTVPSVTSLAHFRQRCGANSCLV